MITGAQFGRVANVVVSKNGVGTRITDLRVKFTVTKTINAVPNSAIVSIYNLNPENEAKIRDEYDDLILEAGYQGTSLVLFRGNFRYTTTYRDGNDFITQISAGDGDKDFRHATVNYTLAAGTTNEQLIEKILKESFTKTKKGYIGLKSAMPRIRGRVFVGNARDVLQQVAAQGDAHWSIQDGLLDIVPVDSTLPTEAIRLTMETGLIGVPEITDGGISVKCLLNPRLKINGKIWLDNNNMKLKAPKDSVKKKGGVRVGELVRQDPDGIYKVFKLEFKGDTRGGGGDWVATAHCVGLDQPIPKSAKAVTSDSSEIIDGEAP